jgi:hypothetical protein
MFTLDGINWVAVAIATIANLLIGALWYSPILFGKEWQQLIGKSTEDLKKNATVGYTGAVILGFITAVVLAMLIKMLDLATSMEGATLGAIIWLGFVATCTGAGMLFQGTRKKLWLIDNGSQLVILAVMGAIIAGWTA